MRFANVNGRLVLVTENGYLDAHKHSGGAISAEPQVALEGFAELRQWARTVDTDVVDFEALAYDELGAPVPAPRQVFAVGLNFDEHAKESGFDRPAAPLVFTKFPSSITGPVTTVKLPSDTVDWEVEVVAVVGKQCRNVGSAHAWDCIAGLMVGQDLSERTSQHAGPAPQFSLAKSHDGFSPTGPWLVTLDEIPDPSALSLGCAVDGDVRQEGSTAQMVFTIPELVAHLSSIVTLYSGDLIFTGTPAGVGAGRQPPVYLKPGQVLTSWVTGLGELRQTFTEERR